MSKNKKEERIGEVYNNYQGCEMTIVEYNNAHDIVVEFQDEHKARVHTEYKNFKNKRVKNPYYPSVFQRGFLGVKYPTTINGEKTKEYKTWQQMMDRCYGDYSYCGYDNASVNLEWWNYENFYEWIHSQSNYEEWYKNDNWALDKDIILKGNKTYAKDRCCLVPKEINSLLINHLSNRSYTAPIGVILDSRCDVYCAVYRGKVLGRTKNIEEAFYLYKNYKESYIKDIAKKYYNLKAITEDCYIALLNYTIDIPDFKEYKLM